MTSPADPRDGAAPPAGPGLKLLAVTACPTGIAHTYMAAEKLTQAAQARGIAMKVETQGSIGAENVLTDNDVSAADGVIVAADKDVDLSRFGGKRVLVVGVAEGISDPDGLIDRVRQAPVHEGGAASSPGGDGRGGTGSGGPGGGAGGSGAAGAPSGPAGAKSRERSVGYKALMNGVSYMIPFVVVGGLLIAVSLALGGHPQADGGLVIPDGSFWKHVNDIGTIGFTLMVPILSGYIAYAIGDRPALVPGMIGGWIANTGELYDSKSGAGFIGAIVTGFLAGYLVRWIKLVPVSRFVRPIMPIIVIPIVATSALGLFFIYVIGKPISWVFENLTDFLGSMTGTSAALLGVVLGLMIAFDMGGPVNKTAFLFGTGLVSKSPEVMGMCAAAIPVPPLGQGLATLLRSRFYSDQERETGLAALFMGFFGITEGAIPFAAARPATVIPANMLGGAVAGGVAGLASVADNVPHGGPIVAVLGAIDGVALFFVAVLIGTAVTALTTAGLVTLGARRSGRGSAEMDSAQAARAERTEAEVAVAAVQQSVVTPRDGAAVRPQDGAAVPPQGATDSTAAGTEAGAATDEVLLGYLTADTVSEQLSAVDKDAGIREMAALLGRSGKVADSAALVRAALAREEQGTTGLGEEIAIPHAKTDAVTAPVVGFARSAEGIEWGALDGTKARLVFMIAVPEAAAGDEHLRILALLSRKLMDPAFRTRLLEASDKETVLNTLAEIE
ncbi:fructose-specific PTS transporter subunit EIIC [Streptomyces sp. CA-250714]|uniref:fructose-specific PTS transporter subunit EIIC n=1 Tax=Streptomyces sp. CA-250714 TaxID=3240060 RepID=UPI003D91F0CC